MYQTCFSGCDLDNVSQISDFIVDSGESVHISHVLSIFSNLKPSNSGKIKLADGLYISVEEYGAMKVIIETPSQPIALTLQNVTDVFDLTIILSTVFSFKKAIWKKKI
jgi:hypothetical protein